ncbi:hypothetical protein RHGRI_000476 [Rhododendron griersonianum]|uniref:Secreted protein n=1 Tax=Rhododendron griersonianum TaxID=479676 RepID=A0AAV6LHM6_9ERIC|nr:hypothetical protein RHGRI_000476 [Rhododendron griersonianum]
MMILLLMTKLVVFFFLKLGLELKCSLLMAPPPIKRYMQVLLRILKKRHSLNHLKLHILCMTYLALNWVLKRHLRE